VTWIGQGSTCSRALNDGIWGSMSGSCSTGVTQAITQLPWKYTTCFAEMTKVYKLNKTIMSTVITDVWFCITGWQCFLRLSMSPCLEINAYSYWLSMVILQSESHRFNNIKPDKMNK
jgi:hypothetical protein